jgi:tRNA(Ile)-lysidine synthase
MEIRAFQTRFTACLQDERMVLRGQRILTAVSGGVDSVVMLDLFRTIADAWNLSLGVIHFNHGMRKKAAGLDESFVRDLARDYGLPFYSCLADVNGFTLREGLSLEEGARELRMRFLVEILERGVYDCVALAHQADDQVETVLMRLAQGAGIRGLGGIRWKRGFFIHPLLAFTRDEVESYALKKKLIFREDRTNKERIYLRNRIRRDVVPCLEKAMGHTVKTSIVRSASAIQDAERLVRRVAEEQEGGIVRRVGRAEIVLDIFPFLRYFKSVQITILSRILEELGGFEKGIRRSTFQQILQLAEKGRSGSRIELAPGLTGIRDRRSLVFYRKLPSFHPIPVKAGETAALPGWGAKFRSGLIDMKISMKDRGTKPDCEYLDFDRLVPPLYIRTQYPGDRFIPLGMKGRKKLHDFFIDSGVPNYRRSSVPLLVDRNGIVWVMGFRIDERVKITRNTIRVLRVEYITESHGDTCPAISPGQRFTNQ